MEMKKKVLAVCRQGENRSRTLARMLNESGRFEAKFAGLWNPENGVTKKLVDWADWIVVFEEEQMAEIERRFPGTLWRKRVINFDIADFYPYNHPGLVKRLELKIADEF
jgi:predicted protein tyrosine phosphatase